MSELRGNFMVGAVSNVDFAFAIATRADQKNRETRGKNAARKTSEARKFSLPSKHRVRSFGLLSCRRHFSSSRVIKAIHILFTPSIFAPCQRLEIRNEPPCRQEKIRSLFSRAAAKNLDGKSALTGQRTHASESIEGKLLGPLRLQVCPTFAHAHSPND